MRSRGRSTVAIASTSTNAGSRFISAVLGFATPSAHRHHASVSGFTPSRAANSARDNRSSPTAPPAAATRPASHASSPSFTSARAITRGAEQRHERGWPVGYLVVDRSSESTRAARRASVLRTSFMRLVCSRWRSVVVASTCPSSATAGPCKQHAADARAHASRLDREPRQRRREGAPRLRQQLEQIRATAEVEAEVRRADARRRARTDVARPTRRRYASPHVQAHAISSLPFPRHG